jgi:hypothetical protein
MDSLTDGVRELYYYADEHGIEVLWNNEIKLSCPCDFNDPFEFHPAPFEAQENDNSKLLECLDIHQASADQIYILCMSKRKDNLRMWAQYAQNHEGMVLCLNFDMGILKELKGRGALVSVTYDKIDRHRIDTKKPTNEDFRQLVTRKGSDWSEEEEMRIWMFADETKRIPGNYKMHERRISYFMGLPSECIKDVILGCRSSMNLYRAVMKIKEEKNAKWTISHVKFDPAKFKLNMGIA